MSKKSKLSVILDSASKIVQIVPKTVEPIADIFISRSRDNRKQKINEDNNSNEREKKNMDDSQEILKKHIDNNNSNPNLTEKQKYTLNRNAEMSYHVERNAFHTNFHV